MQLSSVSRNFCSRNLACNVKLIKLSLTLYDAPSPITCFDFRVLSHFLACLVSISKFTFAGKWHLKLTDMTIRAQGWFSPSEIRPLRASTFIFYVRTILEWGVQIHTLELIDGLKVPPYVIGGTQKRRFLYMHHEYKECEKLVIHYDIGIVTPHYLHNKIKHDQLQLVQIEESHVIYKDDFLKYLWSASNIKSVHIVVPHHGAKRRNTCRPVCYGRVEFACFVEGGWLSFLKHLRHASLVFI
ncbi:unnamed protein product [Thelazia callipaeda]|uniref:DUF563 domain-containing protein n=1 Tax=Thelazia callipaeda TaxID=103827 RepID=A0A0N5D202_THECL|nr:unnamed protein product [Thelazia callipaeda]